MTFASSARAAPCAPRRRPTWIGEDDPIVVNALRRARERALAALGLDLEGNPLDP
jgi:hypothetical protein